MQTGLVDLKPTDLVGRSPQVDGVEEIDRWAVCHERLLNLIVQSLALCSVQFLFGCDYQLTQCWVAVTSKG